MTQQQPDPTYLFALVYKALLNQFEDAETRRRFCLSVELPEAPTVRDIQIVFEDDYLEALGAIILQLSLQAEAVFDVDARSESELFASWGREAHFTSGSLVTRID